MGTSQRHNPSVKGEPNWGKSSTSFSAAIKNLINLEDLEDDMNNDDEDQNDDNQTPEQQQERRTLEKKQRRYNRSYHRNVRNAVKRLIKSSGGTKAVASGSSRALGRAGLAVLYNVFDAFTEINSKGIAGWLSDKGITLEHITWEDLKDILFDVCSEEVVGLDETAANQALRDLLENMSELMNGTDNVEEALNQFLDSRLAIEQIERFIGSYIFAHLYQNFEEKLEKKYDRDTITNNLMPQIKDTIIDDVKSGVNGHRAIDVDLTGEEGHRFIQNEFNDIITNLMEDED